MFSEQTKWRKGSSTNGGAPEELIKAKVLHEISIKAPKFWFKEKIYVDIN